MSDVGLDLPIFLDALFWGNGCLVTDGKARYKRSALTHSSEFAQILNRLEKKSPTAQTALVTHVLSMIKATINAEMDTAVPELTVMGQGVDEEGFPGMTQEELVKRLKPVTSTLWEILEFSMTRKDQSRNKYIHDPDKVWDMIWSLNKVSYPSVQTISFVICQLVFR